MAFKFKNGDRPVDGYTIQRAAGKGGFGEVYYALSDGGREVAIKYLCNNSEMELRGVGACINLKSPHLVSIFDVVKAVDGEPALIMEYVSGPSLRDMLIAEPKGFAPEKAAFFVRELAKGLSYLHERGIVHRDLKPGNVFYEDGYVKIGDYGLSKFMSVSRHSGQTASVGTVHYMAPEIGSGNYAQGVDIYALGVMLYEMLLGRLPFEGSSMAEVLMKHLTSQPELEGLSEPFGKVIRKALEKDPKDRYQNVNELVDDLLDVETVAQSLAGFSTKSLDGAVRNVARQRQAPPPVPHVAAFSRIAPAAPGVAVANPGLGGFRLSPFQTPAMLADDGSICTEARTGQLYYAGFWIRVLASLMDMIIIAGASGLLCAITGISGDPPDGLVVGLAILYDGLLIGKFNGQTLGKKVLGIKVISNDGRPCSVWRSFARAIAGWLNMCTLGLTYLMVAFSDNKRGLHDHIAGTLHIYAIE